MAKRDKRASAGFRKFATPDSLKTDRDDDVFNILSRNTNPDSAVMSQARARGMRTAASRGMLNSSMAGQAAEGAMLEVAVPMASQEAEQRFQKNRSGQDFIEAGTLQDSTESFQAKENAERRAFEAAEAERTRGFNAAEAGKDRVFNRQEGAAGRRLTRVQDGKARRATSNENNKSAGSNMIDNIWRDYGAIERTILSDPDLPADERNRLLKSAQNTVRGRVKTVENIYGRDFGWPKNAFGGGNNRGNSGNKSNKGGNNRGNRRNRGGN